MNMQQAVQSRSSSNGYDNHKIRKDSTTNFNSVGELHQSNSCDRLTYFKSCLIGHQVEVQVLDGSVYSGIFHTSNTEDSGVILRMAYLVRNGSQDLKNISDSPAEPHFKSLIIPAMDLVQVIAKDVPVTKDGFTNEPQHEKQQELMTDSYISQSRHTEVGRELERWVPDQDDPGCPELDNIFDGHWNRGWDQFEVNKTLFGVKSTFDEELYTTKLDKGPQMRELEREALRIAREIEGEQTVDLHLAEERGIHLDGNIEMDEETRFSSVYRGNDDSGYDDNDHTILDSRNDETFGDVSSNVISKTRTAMNRGIINEGTQESSRTLFTGERLPPLAATSRDARHSGLEDHIEHHVTSYPQEDKKMQELKDQSKKSKAEDSNSLNKESCLKFGLSPNATSFDPAPVPSKGLDKGCFFNDLSEDTSCPEVQGMASSLARTSSSASSASDRGGATSTSAGRGLSPSSSVASLSSEKSTLNPHAKEFKFNANAKSFTPFQTPRPSSPVAESSFYYPASMTAVTHMHGMPAGVGPVIYNPQAVPIPQSYYHPNGPQYGQQMTGQTRPVFYMPTYPHEMQYK